MFCFKQVDEQYIKKIEEVRLRGKVSSIKKIDKIIREYFQLLWQN